MFCIIIYVEATSPTSPRSQVRFGDGTDTASIYSAPSMLSIHSAVEATTSRHEGDEVCNTFFDSIVLMAGHSLLLCIDPDIWST